MNLYVLYGKINNILKIMAAILKSLFLPLLLIFATTCTLHAQKADIRPYTVQVDSCTYQHPGILRIYFQFHINDPHPRHRPIGFRVNIAKENVLFSPETGLTAAPQDAEKPTKIYNIYMPFSGYPDTTNMRVVRLDAEVKDLRPDDYQITMQLGHHDSIGFSLYSRPITFNIVCNDVLIDARPYPTSCGETNGKIMARAARGVYPYQFKLNEENWKEDMLFTSLKTGEYTVHAKDAQGCEDSVKVMIQNVKGELPKTPQHLQASDGKCGQVDLVCDSVKNAKKYHFFREGKLVGISAKPSPIDYKGTFSPSPYTVISSNACGESPQSETETGYQKAPPRTCDMPKKFIVSTDEHTLFAKWDSIPDAEGYVFYYKMGKDTTFHQVKLDSNTYIIPNIPNNTSYNVYVKAVCGCEKMSGRTIPVMGVVGYAECGTFKATLQTEATSVTFSMDDAKTNTLIQYRKKGTLAWTETKLKTCVNLSPNTIYEYQGRNVCPDNGLGKWSDIAEFTTSQ